MNSAMRADFDDHCQCMGRCMLLSSNAALAKRASRHKLAPCQLDELLQVLNGRCMLCADCHAMVVDSTSQAVDRRPRGLLCRVCKDRVATYESTYSDDRPLISRCGCKTWDIPDWTERMSAATAQYLERTRRVEELPTNRERFAALIDDFAAHGIDPHGIWNGSPASNWPQLPASERSKLADTSFQDLTPLDREPCLSDCRDHIEHLYIACFGKPTLVRDADTSAAVLHYVGWTRQRPPLRRVNQHGPACRTSLVAIIPGTATEEEWLKTHALCPRCNQPLEYFRRGIRRV